MDRKDTCSGRKTKQERSEVDHLLMLARSRGRSRACDQCYRAHKKCDGCRPCMRCALSGQKNECCDRTIDIPADKNVPEEKVSMFREFSVNPRSCTEERVPSRRPNPVTHTPAMTDIISPVSVVTPSPLHSSMATPHFAQQVVYTLLERLMRRRELFEQRFDFTSMRGDASETIMSLPPKELLFLEEISRAQVNLDPFLTTMFRDSHPVLIQRTATIASVLHNRGLLSSPLNPIHIVNSAFEREFGWSTDRIDRDPAKSVQDIFSPESLSRIDRILQENCASFYSSGDFSRQESGTFQIGQSNNHNPNHSIEIRHFEGNHTIHPSDMSVICSDTWAVYVMFRFYDQRR